MPLRAWWYLHIVKKNRAWPPDVREPVLKNGLKMLKKGKNISPEQQTKISIAELTAALGGEPGDLSPELVNELIGDAFNRLRQVPLEHCAACGRPVLTHKATMLDGKFYCECCGSQAGAANSW